MTITHALLCNLSHLSIQASKHYFNVKNMVQNHGSPSDIFWDVSVKTAFFLEYAIPSITNVIHGR